MLYYYLPALYLKCSPGDHMQHCSALVAGINLKGPASNEITETKSNGVTHSVQQPPNDSLPLRDDHGDVMEDSTIMQDQQHQDEQTHLTSAQDQQHQDEQTRLTSAQDQQHQDEQTQLTSAADTVGIELSTVDSSSDCRNRAPSKHSNSNGVETGMYLHCIL